jgi:hypothetical protein
MYSTYSSKGGNALLTIKSGRRTPIAEIPTPDLAVPYAAPKQVKTMAEVHPIAPKNGYPEVSEALFCCLESVNAKLLESKTSWMDTMERGV